MPDSDPSSRRIHRELVAEGFESAGPVPLREARRWISIFRADLVIVRIAGPAGPGLDLVERLARDHPSLPLVALADFEDRGILLEALAHGAHEALFTSRAGGDTLAWALLCATRRAGRADLPTPAPSASEEDHGDRDPWAALLPGVGLVALRRRLAEDPGRFEELLGHVEPACYLADLAGVFVDGNRAAEELVGYTKAELIGSSFLTLKLLSPGQLPLAAAALAQNAVGRPAGPMRLDLVRRDGRQVPVLAWSCPLPRTGHKRLILGIACPRP